MGLEQTGSPGSRQGSWQGLVSIYGVGREGTRMRGAMEKSCPETSSYPTPPLSSPFLHPLKSHTLSTNFKFFCHGSSSTLLRREERRDGCNHGLKTAVEQDKAARETRVLPRSSFWKSGSCEAFVRGPLSCNQLYNRACPVMISSD